MVIAAVPRAIIQTRVHAKSSKTLGIYWQNRVSAWEEAKYLDLYIPKLGQILA
jgi:hypothetical protein